MGLLLNILGGVGRVANPLVSIMEKYPRVVELVQYRDLTLADLDDSVLTHFLSVFGKENFLTEDLRQAIASLASTQDLRKAVDLIQSPESMVQIIDFLDGGVGAVRSVDEIQNPSGLLEQRTRGNFSSSRRRVARWDDMSS